VTGDPGAVDEDARIGTLLVRFGLGWAKAHTFVTGQTPVMKYHRELDDGHPKWKSPDR
jgi:glutathione-independent formaldehyde dehydrogenase